MYTSLSSLSCLSSAFPQPSVQRADLTWVFSKHAKSIKQKLKIFQTHGFRSFPVIIKSNS